MSFVWTAVAIGGGAILNYIGSQNASNAQTDAANQANATQQQQYNQTRQDQMPWMNRGNAAGNQMSYLLGLPGYGAGGSANGGGTTTAGANPFEPNTGMGGYGSLSTPFSQTNWQADPGYAFRLQQGQQALERSGAARGMTLSGAQAKALDAYGQGMGSQEYQNAYNRYNNDQTSLYNRLAGVAGTGQTATNMTGQLGAQAANGIANTQASLGNALGANYIGTANGITGSINNGLNQWMNQNNWNSLLAQQQTNNAYNNQPNSLGPVWGANP